mgnify:CR=1 FL=1
MKAYDIILYTVMTEVANQMLEAENKLVFGGGPKATTADIKRAVEALYEVQVQKITVSITHKGQKKAFVKLHPDFKASDIAIKLGIL